MMTQKRWSIQQTIHYFISSKTVWLDFCHIEYSLH